MATDPSRVLVPTLTPPLSPADNVTPPKSSAAAPTPSTAALPVPGTPSGTEQLVSLTKGLFDTAPQAIKDAADKVSGAQKNVQGVLDQVSAAMPVLQQQDLDNVTQTVGHQNAINDTVEKVNQNFADGTRPIFARQAAIDARREEVATMSPFKRAVLGLVNRNFNSEHLDKLAATNRDILSDKVQEYSDNTQAADQLFQVATQRGAGEGQIIAAKKALITSKLDTANQVMDLSVRGLAAQTQIVGATHELAATQQMLTDKAIGETSAQDIQKVIADAKKDPNGVATYHGAPITLGQAQSRAQDLDRQTTSLASAHVALAQGQLNLHQDRMNDYVNNLSPSEFQAALSAQSQGQPYKGNVIPYQALAQRVQARAEVERQGGQDALVQGAATGFQDAVTQLHDNTIGMTNRLTQLNGGQPDPESQQYTKGVARTFDQMGVALSKATDPRVKAQIQAQMTQQLSTMQDDQRALVIRMADKYGVSPADKRVKQAYALGATPSQGDVIQSFVDRENMGQGGVPLHGTEVSGPSGAANAAMHNAYVNTLAKLNAGKFTVKERNEQLTQAVAKAAQVYTSHLGNQIQDQIPSLAAAQGHPFAGVSATNWNAARAHGDQTAAQNIATKLGIPINQVNGMLRGDIDISRAPNAIQTSVDPQTGLASKSIKPGFDAQSLSNEMSSQSMALMAQYLDRAQGPLANGQRPSEALADLTRSGAFQTAAGKFAEQKAGFGLGATLADAATGGSIHSNIYNYGRAVSNATALNHSAEIAAQNQQIEGYGSAGKRGTTILSSIPGLDQHSQQVLGQVIRQAADNPAPGLTGSSAVDSMIMNSKFKDPHLERARSVAAKHWEDASKRADQMMNHIKNGYTMEELGRYAGAPLG